MKKRIATGLLASLLIATAAYSSGGLRLIPLTETELTGYTKSVGEIFRTDSDNKLKIQTGASTSEFVVTKPSEYENYSETEVDTKRTFFDQGTIYRRCFKWDGVSTSDTVIASFDQNYKPIHIYGVMKRDYQWYPVSVSNAGNIAYIKYDATGTYAGKIRMPVNGWTITAVRGCIEYTK